MRGIFQKLICFKVDDMMIHFDKNYLLHTVEVNGNVDESDVTKCLTELASVETYLYTLCTSVQCSLFMQTYQKLLRF